MCVLVYQYTYRVYTKTKTKKSYFIYLGEFKATCTFIYLSTKSIPFHFTPTMHSQPSSVHPTCVQYDPIFLPTHSSASFHYSQSQSFSPSLAVLSDIDKVQRYSTSHTAITICIGKEFQHYVFMYHNSLSKPEEEEAQKKNHLKHLFSFHRL